MAQFFNNINFYSANLITKLAMQHCLNEIVIYLMFAVNYTGFPVDYT